MEKNTKEITVFSDSELLTIHKALHDKRRKSILVKGVKCEIFEHSNLRQLKYSATIFSEFEDDKVTTVDKTTIAIRLDDSIKNWPVIENNNIYANKKEYYESLQK